MFKDRVINNIFQECKDILRKTNLYKMRAIKKKHVMNSSDIDEFLNQAPLLFLEKNIQRKPYIGIVKTQVFNIKEGYQNPNASWLRYERFCKSNNIPYSFYEINNSNWLSEAQKYDIIVCHTEGTPAYKEMFESKIYVLEKFLKKSCFPSFHEVWQYEDKNRSHYLYQYYNLPTIPTLITNNKKEAFDIVSRINYPFITKTKIGAGSSGVFKIDNIKQSHKVINRIFRKKGLSTKYPYINQKDYFYYQEFMDDATFDLRIMIIGDKAFGYYRYPNEGDFRASGAGNFEKKELPFDALRLAIDIRNKLQSRQLGVDLLYSKRYSKYFIIETSLFNQIDSASQLEVNGQSGYYDISDTNNMLFIKGKFWVQELLLRDVVTSWSESIV